MNETTRAPYVRRLPLVLTTALAVAVAAWGFSRVIEPGDALLPVLVGAFGPALVISVAVLLTAVLRRPKPPPLGVTLPLSLLLGIGLGPVLGSGLAQGPGPVDSLRAFGDTWRTLLTTTLPAVADSPTVTAILLLVWVATAFAVEAALRARATALALAPTVLVLAVVVGYGLPAGGMAPLLLSGAVAAVAAIHVGLARSVPAPGRDRADLPPSPDRLSALTRAGAVLVVALVAATVGMTAAPRMPFIGARPPFDPRVLVEPPQDTSLGLSALSRVSQWLAEPAHPLFAVDGDLDPSTDRLRLVSLDRYDGRAWTDSQEYVVAGTRLPAGPDAPHAAADRTLELNVALGALPGNWLPAPDRARAVRGVTVKVAPESGDLVTAGQPVAGARYAVTSEVHRADPRALVSAGGGAEPWLDPMRVLPDGRPDVFAKAAQEATAAGTTPIQQLLLLERWMQENLEYDPAALPGHSSGLLERFVDQSNGKSGGTMEQFAAAYAVMARELGFASRVTVGFTPGTAADDPERMASVDTGIKRPEVQAPSDPRLADPGSVLGEGARVVTTRDAMAWPEVWLDGAGWVAFYPVPLPGAAQEQDVISGVGAPPDRVELEDVTPSGSHAQPDTEQPELEETPEQPGVAQQVLLGLATATGALALWLGVVALWRKLARRRSRTRGTPRERVLRAWRQVLGDLDGAGLERVRTLTGEQVVAAGRPLVAEKDGDRLASLAEASRRALFSGRDVSDAEAEKAWDDADAVTRGAARRRGLAGRALELLVPPRRL
ncbi:MAG TPA: transglutaminaseTgpA domain-containing protein [Actinomycetales bacterium]|nr:transglutaminaseTgpA domain-containing protein [Actinomycetales bacterium]